MSARTLVLGLDGATWDVLLPMQDELPNLRRLWTEGVGVPLRSTTPPMTLPSWSSCLTGCSPGTHGIVDFTRRVPGTYRLAFCDARDRRVPTMHEVLSARGRRVASITVPTTYPPTEVNGVVVSGFDSPVATAVEALHCSPRSLHDEITRRFGGLRFADFQEGDIGPAWHAHARDALLREIARKEELCAWLLDREDWDLFMVVFGESDTASHHFWMFHDPRSPRFPGPGPFDDVVRAVYRRLDAAVGALARRGTHVCVVSDHGFGGAGTQALYLNRFLEEAGWLAFRGATHAGAGLRARLDALRARGLDRLRQAAMRLPVEKLLRRMPSSWTSRAETAARWGDLDFARTRAWSDELNYAATVHLNLRGRDPQGCVTDREAALHELTALLLGWEIEGEPVVARVITREEAMPGEGAAGAPDLFLELALEGGYSRTLLPSARVPRGTTWRRLRADEHVGGKGLGMNGSHRQHGVWMLHGPGVRTGAEIPAGDGDAGMADVLPTLFALAGEPIPDHVEGRVRHELLGEHLSVPAGMAAATTPARMAAMPSDDDALRARLERLGYL